MVSGGAGRWGASARVLVLVLLGLLPASSQTVQRRVGLARRTRARLLSLRRRPRPASRGVVRKAVETSPEVMERGYGAEQGQGPAGVSGWSRLEAYPPFDTSYPGVEQIHSEPPVFLVHGLLTDTQCDALIEAAESESLQRIQYSGTFVLLDQQKLRPLVPLCLVAGVPPLVHALEHGDALASALGPATASTGLAALVMAALVKAVPWAVEKALWKIGGGACFTGTKWGTDSLEITLNGADAGADVDAAADAYAEFLQNAQRVLKCAEKERFESPTVTRYGPGEFQLIHTDARPPGDPDGLDLFLKHGGQRLAQCIVYLNSLDAETHQGQTAFHAPELDGLKVTPKKGTALVFFPSFRDGTIDDRMTHSGCAPIDAEKWIVGSWLCQSPVPAWKQKRCVGDII